VELARSTIRVPAIAAVAVLIVVPFSVRSLVSATAVDTRQIAAVDRTAPAIEEKAPKGPVSIGFRPSPWFTEYSIGQGVAWRLTAAGWDPALPPAFSEISGVTYPPHARWPAVTVAQ
jgi:hypothetical protein